MRYLSLLLPLTVMFSPLTALADDTRTAVLPSEDEIEAIIADLPDFNHLLDGLMEIAQDEKIREQMTRSAARIKDDLESSEALKPRENGLPDVNAGLEVMLRALSDKGSLGSLLGTLEHIGKDLETVMEDSVKREDKSPEP